MTMYREQVLKEPPKPSLVQIGGNGNGNGTNGLNGSHAAKQADQEPVGVSGD